VGAPGQPKDINTLRLFCKSAIAHSRAVTKAIAQTCLIYQAPEKVMLGGWAVGRAGAGPAERRYVGTVLGSLTDPLAPASLTSWKLGNVDEDIFSQSGKTREQITLESFDSRRIASSEARHFV
jgi:hypothetical protein